MLAAADVAEGRSDALVSAGPTGATMTAALFALRRIHGVRRPALAVQLAVPGRDGPPSLLLDVGANAEVRPATWSSSPTSAPRSARRCSVSSARAWRCSRSARRRRRGPPRWSRRTRRSPAPTRIDFRGNVEGRDLLADAADVIVTDGFTGNVALKTIEGTASTVADARPRRGALEPGRRRSAACCCVPALGGLRREMDPDTTGGAILLGLRGRRRRRPRQLGPEGIANAIRLAARAVDERAVGADGGAARATRERPERRCVIGRRRAMIEALSLIATR